jgi:hypothetical protein
MHQSSRRARSSSSIANSNPHQRPVQTHIHGDLVARAAPMRNSVRHELTRHQQRLKSAIPPDTYFRQRALKQSTRLSNRLRLRRQPRTHP